MFKRRKGKDIKFVFTFQQVASGFTFHNLITVSLT